MVQDCGDKGRQTQVKLVEIGGRGFFAQLVWKLLLSEYLQYCKIQVYTIQFSSAMWSFDIFVHSNVDFTWWLSFFVDPD